MSFEKTFTFRNRSESGLVLVASSNREQKTKDRRRINGCEHKKKIKKRRQYEGSKHYRGKKKKSEK